MLDSIHCVPQVLGHLDSDRCCACRDFSLQAAWRLIKTQRPACGPAKEQGSREVAGYHLTPVAVVLACSPFLVVPEVACPNTGFRRQLLQLEQAKRGLREKGGGRLRRVLAMPESCSRKEKT